MSLVKMDQGAARAINRSLVLNELRRYGPLSRAKLAERIGLSAAAITFVTSELLREDLIVEQPEQGTERGRRPVPIDINYAGHFAIGIKFNIDRLEGVLTDLSLTVIEELSFPLQGDTPGDVVMGAAQVVERMLSSASIDRSRLIGVGLTLPAVMDVERGICRHSHRLNWVDVPITAMLSSHIGVPAWVENDVNAFATAERLVGRGKHARDFVVVTVGRGIGAALVLNGQLYRGRFGGAGEFGHVLSEPRGRLCECGLHGCLEAYVSETNLLARLAEHGPAYHGLAPADLAPLAASGDVQASALLADAGQRLGHSLADLVNLLNPELIILGGEGVRLGEALFGPLRAALRERAFGDAADDLPLLIEPWGDGAWARGAAGLVAERFFTVREKPHRAVGT